MLTLEHSGIFRKALFGGFDQKAVLNYIEELEQGKAQLKEQLDACLAREESCRQAEEQLVQMEAVLLEKDALIASLTQKNEEISLQLAEKMQSIERRECELSSLQQQADGLIEKSELYENVSGKIGDTLLQAQATADRIVEQAKRDQLNICTQTSEMIEHTMREMENFRANLVAVRGKLGESMES